MAEVDKFLGAVLPGLHAAETAFHNGDAGPRIANWSRNDPVTLFGALLTKQGWAKVGPAFEWLASRRVTTIFRREDGAWKVVHRHGDAMPDSVSARDQLTRFGEQGSHGARSA